MVTSHPPGANSICLAHIPLSIHSFAMTVQLFLFPFFCPSGFAIADPPMSVCDRLLILHFLMRCLFHCRFFSSIFRIHPFNVYPSFPSIYHNFTSQKKHIVLTCLWGAINPLAYISRSHRSHPLQAEHHRRCHGRIVVEPPLRELTPLRRTFPPDGAQA